MSDGSREIARGLLPRIVFVAALAFALFGLGGFAAAQEHTVESARCGIFFGEYSCPAQIPRDEATRLRVRAFCGGLKEAADAVLSGARPGFRMQSGQDMWEGDVNEHRVMWGNVQGRGIYTYDANATDAAHRYELAFFFPGVSAAELKEGLTICPAFFVTVTGTESTPIIFRRSGREGEIEMYVSMESRQYNAQTRVFESGARISLLRQ